MKYKVSDGIALREIMGDSILVPIKETPGFNGIFVLNPTSRIIYDCFLAGRTEEDAVNAILAEYDADRSDVENDVRECIADMTAKYILTEAE